MSHNWNMTFTTINYLGFLYQEPRCLCRGSGSLWTFYFYFAACCCLFQFFIRLYKLFCNSREFPSYTHIAVCCVFTDSCKMFLQDAPLCSPHVSLHKVSHDRTRGRIVCAWEELCLHRHVYFVMKGEQHTEPKEWKTETEVCHPHLYDASSNVALILSMLGSVRPLLPQAPIHMHSQENCIRSFLVSPWLRVYGHPLAPPLFREWSLSGQVTLLSLGFTTSYTSYGIQLLFRLIYIKYIILRDSFYSCGKFVGLSLCNTYCKKQLLTNSRTGDTFEPNLSCICIYGLTTIQYWRMFSDVSEQKHHESPWVNSNAAHRRCGIDRCEQTLTSGLC